MARTVYSRGSSYAPISSAKWYFFGTDPASRTSPTFAELNLSATIDITAGVADFEGLKTGVNIISATEWGSSATTVPFSASTGMTVENPVLWIWADVTATDFRASLSVGARKTFGYFPNADTAASKAEIWDLTCVNTDLEKGKDQFARIGFMFTVNNINKNYTIPAS